ncbi:hypothetical protein HanRHA438_Chr04g0174351 [Helianthus annuus]|nr:hypothetical protein HanRHA438_Chr04g0174351 [Helianthus annuus]
MALASSISAVTGASPLFLKPILFTHKTLLYTSLNDSRRNLSFSLTGRRRKFTGEESSRRKVRSSPHRSSSTHCVHVVGRYNIRQSIRFVYTCACACACSCSIKFSL